MKLNFSAGSTATMAPKSSRHGRSGARAHGPVIDVADDGDGELPDVRGLLPDDVEVFVVAWGVEQEYSKPGGRSLVHKLVFLSSLLCS